MRYIIWSVAALSACGVAAHGDSSEDGSSTSGTSGDSTSTWSDPLPLGDCFGYRFFTVSPGSVTVDWSHADTDVYGQPLDPHDLTELTLTQLSVPADNAEVAICSATATGEDVVNHGRAFNMAETSILLVDQPFTDTVQIFGPDPDPNGTIVINLNDARSHTRLVGALLTHADGDQEADF